MLCIAVFLFYICKKSQCNCSVKKVCECAHHFLNLAAILVEETDILKNKFDQKSILTIPKCVSGWKETFSFLDPTPDYHCGDSHFVRFGMRINSVKGTIGSFWIFLDQNCRQSSKNWHFEKKIHWKSTLTRPKCVSWWKETFSFLDPPSPQNGIQATQCFQHSSWKGKNKKLRHKPAKTNWHQQ